MNSDSKEENGPDPPHSNHIPGLIPRLSGSACDGAGLAGWGGAEGCPPFPNELARSRIPERVPVNQVALQSGVEALPTDVRCRGERVLEESVQLHITQEHATAAMLRIPGVYTWVFSKRKPYFCVIHQSYCRPTGQQLIQQIDCGRIVQRPAIVIDVERSFKPDLTSMKHRRDQERRWNKEHPKGNEKYRPTEKVRKKGIRSEMMAGDGPRRLKAKKGVVSCVGLDDVLVHTPPIMSEAKVVTTQPASAHPDHSEIDHVWAHMLRWFVPGTYRQLDAPGLFVTASQASSSKYVPSSAGSAYFSFEQPKDTAEKVRVIAASTALPRDLASIVASYAVHDFAILASETVPGKNQAPVTESAFWRIAKTQQYAWKEQHAYFRPTLCIFPDIRSTHAVIVKTHIGLTSRFVFETFGHTRCSDSLVPKILSIGLTQLSIWLCPIPEKMVQEQRRDGEWLPQDYARLSNLWSSKPLRDHLCKHFRVNNTSTPGVMECSCEGGDAIVHDLMVAHGTVARFMTQCPTSIEQLDLEAWEYILTRARLLLLNSRPWDEPWSRETQYADHDANTMVYGDELYAVDRYHPADWSESGHYRSNVRARPCDYTSSNHKGDGPGFVVCFAPPVCQRRDHMHRGHPAARRIEEKKGGASEEKKGRERKEAPYYFCDVEKRSGSVVGCPELNHYHYQQHLFNGKEEHTTYVPRRVQIAGRGETIFEEILDGGNVEYVNTDDVKHVEKSAAPLLPSNGGGATVVPNQQKPVESKATSSGTSVVVSGRVYNIADIPKWEGPLPQRAQLPKTPVYVPVELPGVKFGVIQSAVNAIEKRALNAIQDGLGDEVLVERMAAASPEYQAVLDMNIANQAAHELMVETVNEYMKRESNPSYLGYLKAYFPENVDEKDVIDARMLTPRVMGYYTGWRPPPPTRPITPPEPPDPRWVTEECIVYFQGKFLGTTSLWLDIRRWAFKPIPFLKRVESVEVNHRPGLEYAKLEQNRTRAWGFALTKGRVQDVVASEEAADVMSIIAHWYETKQYVHVYSWMLQRIRSREIQLAQRCQLTIKDGRPVGQVSFMNGFNASIASFPDFDFYRESRDPEVRARYNYTIIRGAQEMLAEEYMRLMSVATDTSTLPFRYRAPRSTRSQRGARIVSAR